MGAAVTATRTVSSGCRRKTMTAANRANFGSSLTMAPSFDPSTKSSITHMPMKLIQAHGAWYGWAGPTQAMVAPSRAQSPAAQRQARIDRGLNGR